MMSGKRPMAPRQSNEAYTLLEILLALGVVAVLMGIAVPALMDSFGKSPMEEVSDDIAQTVQAVRSSAVGQSEARKVALAGNGLQPEGGAAVQLPKGWTLEVRRLAESKFRKPEKQETWTFNSAGICEPITLRIRGGREVAELTFDPLTGLVIDE